MKKTFFILLLLFLYSHTCFSQGFGLEDERPSEFGNSKEELIYSDTTISQLKYIVDSLNLKYAICDLNKEYLSSFQVKVELLTISIKNASQAIKDMKIGISYTDFIKKYPECTRGEELLITNSEYEDRNKKKSLVFSSPKLGKKTWSYNLSIEQNVEDFQNNKIITGKWIYEQEEETREFNDMFPTFNVFYVRERIGNNPLKEEYAKMVQYADCMVDTTEQVFYDKAQETSVRFASKNNMKVEGFLEYIAIKTNKPNYDDYQEKKIFYQELYIWDSLRINEVEKLSKQESQFHDLLKDAVVEAIENGGSDDKFEYYVGKYHSKEAELELKRGRRVIGGCSQDNAPRYHALSIAKLSAETVKWEIFLRSHLDIMNDRFSRMSDGSYAWQRRKTYIRELEVLDINVLDLLLGVTLRTENPSQNHYYGSISRIGRALAETNNPNAAETKMLDMIEDNELDTYNRILIYYLFTHYNFNLEDKERQSTNEEKLKKAVTNLPSYISSRIVEGK